MSLFSKKEIQLGVIQIQKRKELYSSLLVVLDGIGFCHILVSPFAWMIDGVLMFSIQMNLEYLERFPIIMLGFFFPIPFNFGYRINYFKFILSNL